MLFNFIDYSCIKQVEIDLPTIETKPVVNCLFSVGNTFKVQISKLTPIEGIYENQIIEDAKCELYCNDKYVENLVFSNGFYYSINTVVEYGKKYTLKIFTSIGNVQATSYAPLFSPIITNLEHNLFNGEYQEWITAGNISSTLSFRFKENQNTIDYYETFIEIERLFKDSTGNFYIFQYELPPLLASNELFIKSESILEYRPKILPFKDSLIDNSTPLLNLFYIYSSPSAGLLYYNLIYHFRIISKELYLYRKSLIKHIYTQQPIDETSTMEEALFNEIGSPVQLYSNIENGYGIFAGYTEIRDTLLIIYENL